MGLNENLREQREKQKKAIPSKVFYNHFFALNYHIISDSNKYNLKTIPFYNSLKLRNENFNIDTIRKLLWLLNNEMSKDELMAALELKNRDNFQKTYIKPAVEVGLIELTLPAKKT